MMDAMATVMTAKVKKAVRNSLAFIKFLWQYILAYNTKTT